MTSLLLTGCYVLAIAIAAVASFCVALVAYELAGRWLDARGRHHCTRRLAKDGATVIPIGRARRLRAARLELARGLLNRRARR